MAKESCLKTKKIKNLERHEARSSTSVSTRLETTVHQPEMRSIDHSYPTHLSFTVHSRLVISLSNLDIIFFQTVLPLGAISKTIEYIVIKIFLLHFSNHYNLLEATALLRTKQLSLFPYPNHYSSGFPWHDQQLQNSYQAEFRILYLCIFILHDNLNFCWKNRILSRIVFYRNSYSADIGVQNSEFCWIRILQALLFF
jgi:hypothetical protein